MTLAVNITDARGRELTQLDPMKVHLLPHRGAIDNKTLETIVEEITPGGYRARRLAWASLVIGVLALLGMTASVIIEGRAAWQDLVKVATNPVIIASNLVWMLWLPIAIVRQRRSRRQRVAAVILKHHHCPHCGYSLTGLPVDPRDGATVCPECAGAWRMDDPATSQEAAGACTSTATSRWLIVLLTVLLAGMALGLTFMFLRS